ncbi:MAG: winged helix-turn-helix domain-containing protein [Deltaproteobacteria bacterium]|nr:winged helix-turn-helix domain-containing protein [Deltaproteobacteria bacterium]MCW5802716.1 winged helix-turn-helix domain-containing protein [Deltaproteobacteria bacterium]
MTGNATQREGGTTVMSTLAVVEEILRETAVPMSVREIVERAGVRLPSKSKTPDTVVARDLSMDIKKKGEESLFIRTSPGRYTLRTLAAATIPAPVNDQVPRMGEVKSLGAAPVRKPAAAAPVTRARTDSDVQGGGFAG